MLLLQALRDSCKSSMKYSARSINFQSNHEPALGERWMHLRGPDSGMASGFRPTSTKQHCCGAVLICLVGGSCSALVSDTREVRQVRSLQTEAGSKLLWPQRAGKIPFAMQALRLGPLAEAVEAVACNLLVPGAQLHAFTQGLPPALQRCRVPDIGAAGTGVCSATTARRFQP